ncbi:CHRD domain-containing protein [Sphingomonas sp. SCN 67-18]|mgnify:CR=1 FL=1|uniref:CHRD domain-containing protein n=1 Tax=uncultured Sphingomonas sp. TaxID=158754 RepID=UPI000AD9326E|nr:CHRD domain-containing protein [Sphingomonas sp. SCN 67-18]
MTLRFFALAAMAGLSVAAAGPLAAETVRYGATLSGFAQVPPNEGAGTGTVEATLDSETNAFTYTITYSGLTGPAVAAHFHGPAAADANAPPVIGMKDTASPISGSAVLTAAQVEDLKAGRWYFNVHTKDNPGGEIRGQIVAQ